MATASEGAVAAGAPEATAGPPETAAGAPEATAGEAAAGAPPEAAANAPEGILATVLEQVTLEALEQGAEAHRWSASSLS